MTVLRTIGSFLVFELMWALVTAVGTLWLGTHLPLWARLVYATVWTVYGNWFMLLWWGVWSIKPALEAAYEALMRKLLDAATSAVERAATVAAEKIQAAPLEKADTYRQTLVGYLETGADTIQFAATVEGIAPFVPPQLMHWVEQWLGSTLREYAQRDLASVLAELEIEQLFDERRKADFRGWLRKQIEQRLDAKMGDKARLFIKMWLIVNIVFGVFFSIPFVFLTFINWIAA